MTSSRPVLVVLVSSSLIICTGGLMRWRARRRAKNVAEKAQKLSVDGPLIDGNDEVVRQQIIERATRRASKWMSYQNAIAEELQGQVGGLSKNKRRMMRLAPDYVLKHVRHDHRGYREVAFYEAVKAASSQKSGAGYSLSSKAGILGKLSPIEVFDTFSMFVAICIQDPVVVSSEQELIRSWSSKKKESELLRRLSNFAPAYYGVVKEELLVSPGNSYNDDEACLSETFILMQDVTAKFSMPCAIDIKMGTQTYEPDATDEKRTRECEKYPPQVEFGLRLVSFRIYDPAHPEAGDDGFRIFPKTFGRALESRADLLSAFRMFFSCREESSANENGEKPSESRLRKRVVTNILKQLKLLRSWFDDNDAFAFYASSLFLVYDGDSSRGDATSTKLIDFGHVRRESGGDPGYRLGLRTLISLLTSLLEDAQPSAE